MDIFVNLKSSANSAKKAIEGASNATKNLGKNTQTANSGALKFFSSLKKTNKQFTNITKDVNRASSSLTGFGKAFTTAIPLIGIYKIVNALKTAIQSAMDMIETQNLFNVALGDSANSATDFLTKMSNASGMDITNLKSATGTFALLARSMGFSSEQAETLSTTSSQLALDLASLVNIPITQALGDIKSGLIGQTETMYKYGVDLTEATLKQEALSEGISKSVRLMTQGEKMGLRYNLMIKQTALSHGDFARTIEQPANQMKILSERFVTAGRAIGTIFIPALTVILPIANAILIVITKLANSIATLFGYTPPEQPAVNGIGAISEDADSASDSINGTTSALKELKNESLGFDELNTISSDDSTSSGSGTTDSGASGGSGIGAIDLATYDSGMSNVVSKADIYATEIQEAFTKKDWSTIGFVIANGINSFTDNVNESTIFKKISNMGNTFNTAFGTILNTAISNIKWTSLGLLFGNGINTIVSFSLGLIKSINFVNIGSALANFLNGALLSINFSNLGALFVSRFTIIIDLLYGFVTNFDFTRLGTAISDFINGAIDAIDFEKVGNTISTAVLGLLDTVGIALKNIKWEEIGNDIETLLISIDWNLIIYKLAQVIGYALGGIAKLLWGVIDDAVNGIITYFSDTIKANGGYVVLGLLYGMLNALVNIATWLSTNIIEPIVNSIKDLFGIQASEPSTVFSGIGTSLIDGLLGGITETWDKITTYFSTVWDTTKTTFETGWETIKESASKLSEWFSLNVTDPIENLFKTMVNSVISFFETLLNGVIRGLNKFIGKVNVLLSKIDSVSDKLGFDIHLSIGEISEVSLPRLATGGILQRGQMFEAGENGKSEMLGNYKGKTTVMPLENTDFVSAMYDAVSNAISNNQSSNEQIIENVMTLDGDVIYRNQQKVSKKRGHDFGLGAFAR